jgi:hypothetical protein
MSKVAKGLLIAVDYDNTWSAAPDLFEAIGLSLRKAKARVVILSANPDMKDLLDKQDIDEDAYDEIVTVPEPSDKSKAKWLKDNEADLLIDNKHANVIAALDVTNACEFYAGPTNIDVEHKSDHGHSHEHREQMCCDGRTAHDHRSVDGVCCTDPKTVLCPDGQRRAVTFENDKPQVITPSGSKVIGTLKGDVFTPDSGSHKMWYNLKEEHV